MASRSLIDRKQNPPWTTAAVVNGDEQGRLKSVPRKMRLLEGVKSVNKMSKLLFNVTFERSLGAVQVVISPDATVADLIRSAVEIYLREKRRPLLPHPVTALCFELHYSPFSLDCLDPGKKLISMTSRNCFLYTKLVAAASMSALSLSCSDEAKKVIEVAPGPHFR